MKTAPQLQGEVRDFWDNKPCNSELSRHEPGSKQFFLDIEASRYNYEAHVNDVLDKIDWRGKQVLEIGTGVGTDARNLIARGGLYTGINIDNGSTQISNRALSIFGLPPTVQQASATDMPFKDETFDVVYCFGVLMCIPEIDRAIAEIRRVLKPGGMILIMVYNRSSINYHIEIMFLRKLFLRVLLVPGAVGLMSALGFERQKLARHVELYRAKGPMDDVEWLSRNTDGPDNPYATVYGAEEVRGLFRSFNIMANETYFFDQRHWGFLGKLMPKALIRWLGRHWGWHRIVHAAKPLDATKAGSEAAAR
jgi:ubiquinone/menaquinone biosynthesis C-methylase UbiE